MGKRTFPIAIFTTFGLLQADRPQSTYSCFLPLCTHVLSSSRSQGGTSSQHSDTTWIAVKQELLEVFLCAVTTWSVFQLKQVFDLNHILWNWKARSDRIWLSSWFQLLLLKQFLSGFKHQRAYLESIQVLKTVTGNACVCVPLLEIHSLQVETWGLKFWALFFYFKQLLISQTGTHMAWGQRVH